MLYTLEEIIDKYKIHSKMIKFWREIKFVFLTSSSNVQTKI